jgi:hypothetical protein
MPPNAPCDPWLSVGKTSGVAVASLLPPLNEWLDRERARKPLLLKATLRMGAVPQKSATRSVALRFPQDKENG